MVKIKLVLLGDTYPLDADKIVRFGERSSTFKIIGVPEEIANPEFLNNGQIHLLNNDIENHFVDYRFNDIDFIAVIANRNLEGNFFARPISDKIVIMSILDVDRFVNEGITVDMYINRMLLGYSTIYKAFKDMRNTSIFQKNTRGCLFDLCIYKPDIARFFRKPKLSSSALAILEAQVSSDFSRKLKKDISKLEISPYYKLRDWFKKNPIQAIVISFLIQQVVSESAAMIKGYLYGLF
jgi:hypothetical protein